MKPKVVIPTGLGINSHEELAYCFEQAGAQPEFRLWNELIADPSILDQYQGAGLSGGFAMGDKLGAGQSLANRIRLSELNAKLKGKIDDPNFPMYIVCNSFQMLAKLNFFPIPVGTTRNASGKHTTGFWDLAVNPNNETVWLKYLQGYDGPIFAPASHGEGRIQVDEKALDANPGVVAFTHYKGHICDFFESSLQGQYCPNGSDRDIGGFGWNNNLVHFLHFERLHHDFQRPDREGVRASTGTTKNLYEPTYLIFKAAVDFMKERM